MIDFLPANWGSWVSVAGLMVSLVGLTWAIIVARGARAASLAAHRAASEATESIRRHLQTVDLERVIALIQRIKLLHDTDRWEAAMEQYQALRRALSDIITRCPDDQAERRQKLTIARRRVSSMEDFVGGHINRDIEDSERANLNQELNEIQSALEELASDMGFGDSPEETR